ncbi:MAG: prolyl oligopeptidase family serine peptidase [Clostridiales bacterium]|nr:prolyl oligopeptidase family serine peptidase [Clostridiales bacterium]
MLSRKIIAVFVLLSVLIMTPMATYAEENINVVDDELEISLYERTDNPELWMQFIEENADSSIGRWLPLLIKKLVSDDPTAKKEVVDMKYNTVTSVYDWGPAINKLVLDLDQPVDIESIDLETFEVNSVRFFKDLDFQTFTLAEEETEHTTPRTVTSVYTSDKSGVADENGSYVTLELAVGPTLTEGSPFNYNFATSRNEFVKHHHEISVRPGKEIKSLDDKSITFMPASEDEYAEDIKYLTDEFTHNESFASNDVTLGYAYYAPIKEEETDDVPLIIWLHGAGEGGEDTRITVMGNEVVNLITEETQDYFGNSGAYVLAPQAPTMWMDYDGTNIYNSEVVDSMGTSYYTEALMGLIDDFVATHDDIDTNRIYIGGCSNGGYMTVNMILTHPEYFAAAFPICEAYSAEWLSEEKIQSIVDLPLWLTHSLDDSVVAIAEGISKGFMGYEVLTDENGQPILKEDFSNALYDQLIEAGAEQVYYSQFENVVDTTGLYKNFDGSPYSYMGHFSWIYTLNNECTETIDGESVTIFEWLGQQTK